MTRRANHTITQSVPTPPHPPVVSPSHLRDRLVDKHVPNQVHGRTTKVINSDRCLLGTTVRYMHPRY